mmetsp:Transcript_6004/g.13747  ORF Transcript_6004/g.13747 Transcript_6004/m.13747 type:complete len:93 (+) Transcript_6004:153-431(+)
MPGQERCSEVAAGILGSAGEEEARVPGQDLVVEAAAGCLKQFNLILRLSTGASAATAATGRGAAGHWPERRLGERWAGVPGAARLSLCSQVA